MVAADGFTPRCSDWSRQLSEEKVQRLPADLLNELMTGPRMSMSDV